MKAAIFETAHKPLSIEDIDIIDPRPGEVLVRTVCSGVCQAVHFVDGLWTPPLPLEEANHAFQLMKDGTVACSVLETSPA